MHSEDQIQLMMLKTKDGLNEIPKGKGRGSNLKIWSSVIYHKNDNDIEDISANQENDLSTKRSQGERNYFRNSEALENFHCAIGPVLKAAQIFGMFPVSGVGSSSLSKLQFKIFSFLTIYSGFIALMVSFMTIVSMIHMLKTFNANTFQIRGGLGAATVGAVFYGNSLVGSILFFSLSSRWVSLQYEWRAMERYIDRSISRSYKQKLAIIREFADRVVCRLSAVHASFRYPLIVQETTIISLF